MEFSSQTGIGVQFHHSSVLGGSSRRCLAFNPNHRPEHMSQVLSTLREIAVELGEPVDAEIDPGISWDDESSEPGDE